MKYWLMKSEPGTGEGGYSIDNFARDKKSAWTGVRNFQARNFMSKEMSEGDLAIFYHSNSDPSAAVGLMRVCSEPHADKTAFDKKSKYYDNRSTPEKPVWECIDVEFVEKFPKLVSLADIRANKKLAKMALLKRGNRLSIQPVTEAEFYEVCKMAGSKKA